MSLSDLASIGSLVSGLAVLVSLIYLSIQVRQAERNQRAAVHQAMIARLNEMGLRIVDGPLAALHFRAMSGADDFSGAELLQLTYLALAHANQAADALVQRRANLIDDAMFETAMGPVRTVFRAPVYRAIWPLGRDGYGRALRDAIEAEIYRLPPLGPVDWVAEFRTHLANPASSETYRRAVGSGELLQRAHAERQQNV
jgi:hypothetical protein